MRKHISRASRLFLRGLAQCSPEDFLFFSVVKTGYYRWLNPFHKEHKEPNLAVWCYSRALLTFIQNGDSATARKQLKKAITLNPHAAEYLLDYKPLPLMPESYSLGTEEEGVICANTLQRAWDATPESLDWLEERMD